MEPASLILESVVAHLRALGPKAWQPVADATEVSIHTIRKIAYKDRKNPGIQTVEKLYTHLNKGK